jgi:hypothetical protein
MDAEDPNKRLTSLKQQFEKGEKDPEFLKTWRSLPFIMMLNLQGKFEPLFSTETTLDQEDAQCFFQVSNY